jgi:hypothetical protein
MVLELKRFVILRETEGLLNLDRDASLRTA